MTIRKGILALCMVDFLVVSALSMVGHDIYLPRSVLGELTGNEGGRLVVIRSAVFLTMAFLFFVIFGTSVRCPRLLRFKSLRTVCWSSACFGYRFPPNTGSIG